MILFHGVAEVLDLSKWELAHSDQARSRRDLVSERVPDLSRREGKSALVELEQSFEVDEDALRGLWAKETFHSTGRSDVGLDKWVKIQSNNLDMIPGTSS